MIGILAKKKLMTRIVAEDGKALAVTLLEAEPNVVTKVLTKEKDGYDALQLGMGTSRKLKKPQKEALRGLGQFRYLKEIRGRAEGVKVGDRVTLEIFTPNEEVGIRGISKGKGFAGTVKRHGFHRGPTTHGHDHHRAPGSIGAMGISRVLPGRRMAGRMGNERITLKKVKVVAVDKESHQLLVTGGVPGSRNSLVIVFKR